MLNVGGDWKSWFAEIEQLIRIKLDAEYADEWKELYKRTSEVDCASFQLLFNESESVYKMDYYGYNDGQSFEVIVWYDESCNHEQAIEKAEAKWRSIMKQLKKDRQEIAG